MARKGQDLEYQLREIRKQLSEQNNCLELRTEGKLSLLTDLKDFYRKRGEVEFEYAKNLERLCERFERNTKQRNLKHEVRSTFNLWSTLLAETRRMARDKASFAEVLSLEMGARIDIMSRDVVSIARKCKDLCAEVQENLVKELKDLNEQSKVYQYSCHHCTEAHTKLVKSQEKVESAKSSAIRKKKAEEKEKERRRQYNEQKGRLLKARNEYLLRLASSNARCLHFYSVDMMSIIEFMDHDYHESFKRLAQAYADAEKSSCNQALTATSGLVNQAQTLHFENDLHYFLSEFSSVFTHPPEFHFVPFGDDDVMEYKVNMKDVFLKAQEVVKNVTVEINNLQASIDEDTKTIEHMSSKNLQKYKVQSIDDALGVLEEAGEPIPPENPSKTSSLDRGNLPQATRGVFALHNSQKGKEDTFSFTLGVFSRKLFRAAQLNVSTAKLRIVDKSLSEQKVPPVSVDGDYRVPKLFGGDCLEYIMATGSNIPLILSSCCDAILKEGVTTEGLFRVPGPAQQIDDLKKGFEEGRDPLAYSAVRNIEITGVASVLKLYFRELVNPLFPCEKYYEFVKCARKDDPQERLDNIRDAVNKLHPAIGGVMRYLFRFLFKVSQHSSKTKMNTANLALVFGPTLTRAPEDADPRVLHNDVPAINVLIQLCIEQYEYIFGEESEDEGLSSPPPPPLPILETSFLGTSPNDVSFHYNEGPSPPPPPDEEPAAQFEEDEEVCELPVDEPSDDPPAVETKDTSSVDPPASVDLPPATASASIILSPTEPVTMNVTELAVEPVSPPVVPGTVPVAPPVVPGTVPVAPPVIPGTIPVAPPVVPGTTPVVPETEPVAPPVIPGTVPVAPPVIPGTVPVAPPVVPGTVPVAPPVVPGTVPVAPPVVPGTAPVAPVVPQVVMSEETKSVESKVEAGGLTTEPARDSVGLSTQISTVSVSGDISMLDQALQDIETSIEEMKERPSSRESTPAIKEDDDEDEESDESDTEEVMTISAKALYDYKARTEKELSFSKGDMLDVIDKTQDGNWWDGFHGGKRGYIPVKYVEISELQPIPVPPQRKSSMNTGGKEEGDSGSTSPLPTVQEASPESNNNTAGPTPQEADTTQTDVNKPETVPSTGGDSPKHTPAESPKRKKPTVPVKTGAVSKLTQQFQQPQHPAPPPPSQRVLVGPHKTHVRNPSADMNKGTATSAGEGGTPVRSNSSGSKPPKPPLVAPRPAKPDPPPAAVSPFPLMSHDSHTSSPLQKAHLQGQVSKPQATTSHTAPVKKGGVFRSSGKRDKPPLPSKPPAPAKPTGSVQLQAELSAAVTRRSKKPEGEGTS